MYHPRSLIKSSLFIRQSWSIIQASFASISTSLVPKELRLDFPEMPHTNGSPKFVGPGEKDWRLVARTSDVQLTSLTLNYNECWWCAKHVPFDLSSYQGDKKRNVKSFEKLLLAIYARDYIIAKIDALESMVELADYYGMLPILSRTLDHAVGRCYEFTDDVIYEHPILVLKLAAKLRNHLLFRDALCYAAGDWGNVNHLRIRDNGLRQLVERAHNEIMVKVMETQQRLMKVLYNENGTDGEYIHSIYPVISLIH